MRKNKTAQSSLETKTLTKNLLFCGFALLAGATGTLAQDDSTDDSKQAGTFEPADDGISALQKIIEQKNEIIERQNELIEHQRAALNAGGDKDSARKRDFSRNKNSFTLSTVAGAGYIESEELVYLYGLMLEYRRTLADSRCDFCNRGNRLLLSAKLGYTVGESFDDDYQYYEYGIRYRYTDITYVPMTIGLTWQHQLGSNVSTTLGLFAGGTYTKADYKAYSYDYGGSDSVDEFSFCAGLTMGLCIEFARHHAIEFGLDLYYKKSDTDEDEAPNWEENQAFVLFHLGYGFHF